MGQGSFSQREAFGVRAACCRYGTVLQHRKRQQAARTPNASRPGAFRPHRHTSLNLCRRALSVRVTDAKEVGVGNPAEETFYHPDAQFIAKTSAAVKPCRWKIFSARRETGFSCPTEIWHRLAVP